MAHQKTSIQNGKRTEKILNLGMANDKLPEIRVTNVPRNLKSDLEIIAENLGIDMAAFMKMKFYEIRNSFPADMLKKRK